MYHFKYVSKKEAAPYKTQLIELLNRVQDYVRGEFTFQFTFIGSSSRNMITYDPMINYRPRLLISDITNRKAASSSAGAISA